MTANRNVTFATVRSLCDYYRFVPTFRLLSSTGKSKVGKNLGPRSGFCLWTQSRLTNNSDYYSPSFNCWLLFTFISLLTIIHLHFIADYYSPSFHLHWENQWRSGSASDSNTKGLGFEPRQGQGFSSSYVTPEILGAGDSHVLRMRR
jgi:hypothetical protein